MAEEYKKLDLRSSIKFRPEGKEDNIGNIMQTSGTRTAKKSAWGITDYKWTDEIDTSIDDFENVPRMILSEFQPAQNINWGEKWDKLVQVSKTAVYSLGQEATNLIGAKVVNGIDAGTEYLKGLVPGSFLGVYEIPFLSDDYLTASGSNGWSADNTNGGGGGGKGFKEFIVDKVKGALRGDAAPKVPIWKNPNENLSYKSQFFLINTREEDFFNNFRFINSLTAGCYFAQEGLNFISPNLFDVEVPGRFHSYYSAVSVDVKYAGRVRKLSNETAGKLGLKSILIPETYNVNITITDLTPNNFNVYADYLNTHKNSISSRSDGSSRVGGYGSNISQGGKATFVSDFTYD